MTVSVIDADFAAAPIAHEYFSLIVTVDVSNGEFITNLEITLVRS
jgi:hypothetical protein